MRTDVVAATGFTEREDLVRMAREKSYLSIPIVDGEQRLIGAVRASDILGVGEEKVAEDLQILFGGGADETARSPVLFKVSRRLPWLHVNLVTAFLAGAVVSMFEGLIAELSVLAVFLPIIAGQGGNAGTQSLSVILRGLVMREVRVEQMWDLVRREALVGLINGVATGIVTGVVAWLWKGNVYLGLVVTAAMIVNLLAAGLAGALIPVTMKRFGFDPAQSSGIILTTVTDVVGFFAFLGFASLFAHRLV